MGDQMNWQKIITMLEQFRTCIGNDIRGLEKDRARFYWAFGIESTDQHTLSLIAEGKKRIKEVTQGIKFLEGKT